MAQNEEIVRAAYDRLNRGDVEGLIDLCDDDFLMDMSERVFNPDTYRGHDDIRRFYEGVRSVWESYQWNIEETRAAGGRSRFGSTGTPRGHSRPPGCRASRGPAPAPAPVG